MKAFIDDEWEAWHRDDISLVQTNWSKTTEAKNCLALKFKLFELWSIRALTEDFPICAQKKQASLVEFVSISAQNFFDSVDASQIAYRDCLVNSVYYPVDKWSHLWMTIIHFDEFGPSS